MESLVAIQPPRHRGKGAVTAALAAGTALALDGFYVAIQYGQNPGDLQHPPVQFWIAYTGIVALTAAAGAIGFNRHLRVAFCSLAVGGALTCLVLGIFSIGVLYAVPLGLAVAALASILNERIEISDMAISGAALLAMVFIMVAGFQLFSLT